MLTAGALFGFPASATTGAGESGQVHIHQPTNAADVDTPALHPSVGVDENLGGRIPLDLAFRDERGNDVRLQDLIQKPTILALVFYHCPQACNLIQGNLAATLNQTTMQAGEDYQVLSVSFDDEEGPAQARQAKANYLPIFERPFPENQWRFLTGSQDSIQRLTAALGYRFQKVGRHNFVHPNLIVVLGSDGQIIRYLYGLSYLPFDVAMAVTEASRGTPGISIKKLVSYCFSYDSQKKRYVFRTFRILGTVMLLGVVAFYVFFLRKGPASREKRSG